MIRDAFAILFLILAGLFLAASILLTLVLHLDRVEPETPAVRDPQQVRVV